MSCVQSNHSDIPRLCRARGRAPRGVVPPHVAADLGRGATPGAVRAVRVWGRRRVRRVGRILTTINTKSIDHCTGVAWLELSLRECAPRPRTRRLPGGGAAWALPTSEKAKRCRRQLSSPSWPVFSASFGVECVRGISWLITPSTRPRSSSPSTSVIRMY